MVTSLVRLGDLTIGGGSPFALIAGPCVLESEEHATMIACELATIATRVGVPLIFKASYDKANRTSATSFRGPGLREGLRMLAAIKSRVDVPILTDIHETSQARPAAEVADILQIPAFLSRQTDLIVEAARTGRAVNIKKGQFLAPDDLRYAVAKATSVGNTRVLITERGTTFGYHDLVVDMRALPMMRTQLGVPIVFDVTHSLQRPGGGDGVSGGLAAYIEPLASAGVGAGVDALFFEVHDDPSQARSDAQNALRLDLVEPLLRRLVAIDDIVKRAERQTRAALAASIPA
jgi:2-dehydro-3-deoxyphosphooctonate aldolase (KDO 8-P synthase)